jgi:pimeloyl-ACP methyl ester carboxylesterase
MADAPVLLLHGFATSAARTWGENGWLDILGDSGRTVVAPDLPGHGAPPQPRDPEAYADLAAQVAAGLPPGQIDGIGFSLGARTLLQMAVAEPSRFNRLVVAGVGANLFRTDSSGLIVKALRGEGDPANPMARYFATLAADPQSDTQALIAVMEAAQPPLTAEALAAVTCPVLVVLGDRDFAGPADPLVEALPNAKLVILRNTDHFATPKAFPFIDATLQVLGL